MVWCIVMRGPQPLSMRSAVDLRTVLETTPVGGRSVVLPDGMGAAMPEPVPEPRPAVDGPTAARELVVLGTASQMPTRDRNHNGYLLRWDGEAILFDPGEGAQRQLLLAGESAASITTVCVTHFHGDHCLGLPGMLHRMAQDGVRRAVDIAFPAAARGDYERLRDVAGAGAPPLTEHPVAGDGLVLETPRFALRAMALDHRTATVGWRLEEPDSRRMLPERLAAAGVHGPMIGRLQREGRVALGDAVVRLEDVSAPRPGQKLAFVMDTRVCDAAYELARGVDVLVCESTFLQEEADLAEAYGHLTALQAGRIAAEAGARLLVLSHYSQRHPDPSVYAEEARRVHPATVAARDLTRIAVPPRRRVAPER